MNELGELTMEWFDTKPREELHDTQNDPDEFKNLADDPQYQAELEEMRAAYQVWRTIVGDKSEIPEKQMIASMWDEQGEPPMTATPVVLKTEKGIKLYCDTEGASIVYQIRKPDETDQVLEHPIVSWDFGSLLKPENKERTHIQV